MLKIIRQIFCLKETATCVVVTVETAEKRAENKVTEMYSYDVNASINCKVLPLF